MQGFYFLVSIWVIILLYSRYNKNWTEAYSGYAALFLVIICSPYTIEFASIEVNISYIVLILIVSYFVSMLGIRSQIQQYFKGLIIGMTFCTMSILAIYDPASFFVSQFLSLVFITVVLAKFLSKNLSEQVRLLCIGFIQGELFNFFTYRSIQVDYMIGDLAWLDCLFFAILATSLIKLLSLSLSKKNLKSRKLAKN